MPSDSPEGSRTERIGHTGWPLSLNSTEFGRSLVEASVPFIHTSSKRSQSAERLHTANAGDFTGVGTEHGRQMIPLHSRDVSGRPMPHYWPVWMGRHVFIYKGSRWWLMA